MVKIYNKIVHRDSFSKLLVDVNMKRKWKTALKKRHTSLNISPITVNDYYKNLLIHNLRLFVIVAFALTMNDDYTLSRT